MITYLITTPDQNDTILAILRALEVRYSQIEWPPKDNRPQADPAKCPYCDQRITQNVCLNCGAIRPEPEPKPDLNGNVFASGIVWDDTKRPAPAAVPDPGTTVLEGHTYIVTKGDESGEQKIVVLPQWRDQIGKPLGEHCHHDPACPKCHPKAGPFTLTGVSWVPPGTPGASGQVDPKPLAVGDRFRVSDVQADAELRKRLEGCKVRVWNDEIAKWFRPELYEGNGLTEVRDGAGVFSLTDVLEYHKSYTGKVMFYEIASLPEEVKPAAPRVNENVKPEDIKFRKLKPDPAPQDFRERYRAGHRYIITNNIGVHCLWVKASDDLDGKPITAGNVKHDSRNCPECHRIARERRKAKRSLDE